MIYGLVAALGWGLADFFAHLAGRRLGSLMAVVIGQIFAAVAITVLLASSGRGALVVVGLVVARRDQRRFAMSAYALHYHALELGPVSVVSPIGAGYAVVGVCSAIVILGERPSTLALVGIAPRSRVRSSSRPISARCVRGCVRGRRGCGGAWRRR